MTIVMICSFYLYAGAAVAAVFLLFGMGQIDENAQGAWIFRPLLIPGVLLIWPLVLWRWWQIETDSAGWAGRFRPIRKGHQLAAVLLAVGLIAALWLGLSQRQSWPADIAPVQLSVGDGS